MGFYHVTLEHFALEPGVGGRAFDALDGVDNWSVGYIRSGEYLAMAEAARTRRAPELPDALDAPVYSGQLALCVSDVTGRSFCYALDVD